MLGWLNLFVCSGNCVWKYDKGIDPKFVIKSKLGDYYKMGKIYNNVFVLDQSTIAENEHQKLHIAIKSIRHIVITHRIYMECKLNRRNTLAPFYCSNSSHITE